MGRAGLLGLRGIELSCAFWAAQWGTFGLVL